MTKARRHYNANFICWACWACSHQDELLWTNTHESAGWRVTRESMQDYLANTPAPQRPAILELPGFHKAMVLPDLMHTLFLGVGRLFVGSCLLEMAGSGLWGDPTNLDRCLETALQQHKNWLQTERCGSCSLDRLTVRALQDPSGFPELPGKASDCKRMIPWISLQACLHALGRGSYERLYASAAYGLAYFVFVLDSASMWMTKEERQAAYTAGDTFVQAYVQLARISVDQQRLRWALRPKLHMLQHLVIALQDRHIEMCLARCPTACGNRHAKHACTFQHASVPGVCAEPALQQLLGR